MNNSGTRSFLGFVGELSALGAGVFALSFLYGFYEYQSFLNALGVNWGGAVQLPTMYAIRSMDMFVGVAPYMVMAFAYFRYASSPELLRIVFFMTFLVGFAFIFLGLWIVCCGYAESIPETAALVVEWTRGAYMVLGVYIAAVLVCVMDLNVYRGWVAIASVLCLYISLFMFPGTMGDAKGFSVSSSQGGSLPYILEGKVKWFVVDYQIGGSLLVRYEDRYKPVVMYKSIEGLEVRRGTVE